jgi:hypothetical protein
LRAAAESGPNSVGGKTRKHTNILPGDVAAFVRASVTVDGPLDLIETLSNGITDRLLSSFVPLPYPRPHVQQGLSHAATPLPAPLPFAGR